MPFEPPLGASGCVLVGSRSAAARRLLRPCRPSPSGGSRCHRTYESGHL